MFDGEVVLHALAAAGGDPADVLHLSSTHVPAVGPFERAIWEVSGPEALIAGAGAGLPDGAARAEAIAVRLRRQGVSMSWGPSRTLSRRPLLAACRARGASSVAMVRADPGLATEMRIGSWFNASPLGRATRRVALRAPAVALRAVPLKVATDGAFWRGVRGVAEPIEWHRWTRSAYVVLCYHRIAGERKPGQERLDMAPRRFRRQLRALRVAGFRPLSVPELLTFHEDPGAVLEGRRYVLTSDDAFADCVAELRRHPQTRPHVYVPTREAGGVARWADGEPLADWAALRELATAGGVVGSHTRTHASLPDLDDAGLASEVAGSLQELEASLPHAAPLLAYPHGRHDRHVREAAQAAGYRLAWTTALGRNAAGTDPFCLRRVGPKSWHGSLGILYLAMTGTLLPGPLERRLSRRSAAPAGR